MKLDCTIYKTLDFIGKKWTLLILLELYKGKSKFKRYSILKKALPTITPKILSARLKELREQGLIIKEVDSSTIPIKSEYTLTEAGNEFINIIQDIKKWALKYKFKDKICEHQDCKDCEF